MHLDSVCLRRVTQPDEQGWAGLARHAFSGPQLAMQATIADVDHDPGAKGIACRPLPRGCSRMVPSFEL